MKITIYHSEKKLKEPYKSLFLEYKKRLSPYTEIETKKFKTKEKSLDKSSLSIGINHNFTLKSSEDLAELFSDFRKNSNTKINIYLNTDNIDTDIKLGLLSFNSSENILLSVLVEQIFRSFTIIDNRNYHK